eukprot:Skav229824  [mRNA]  locus=scaffold2672:118164:121313:+ [translate_table: standard]
MISTSQVLVNGQLTSSLTKSQIGEALRHTRPLTLTVARLAAVPPTAAAAQGRRGSAAATSVLTLEVKETDERLGFKAGGKPPGEVYVEKIFANLWAEKQGLQLKDVLEEINGQKLQPEQLDQLIKTRPLTLVFRRKAGEAKAPPSSKAGPRSPEAAAKPKAKSKAEVLAPSGPLKETVDLEVPMGEKHLGFVPWGLPPARVMVRQASPATGQPWWSSI